MLKLLNEFMNCEKLLAEKWILSSLWMKEKRIQEIETQFLAILNAKFAESETEIDVTIAELFIKCLEISQFQTISRLFDASLSHVTSSLSLTSNTTQRSRAMKSLSQILVNCSLEKSTQLLARSDLQMAMRSALLDASTSVREATVDLIGRFVLQSKSMELCDKYCDLIGERILDTGVSVRKRVIKILRDICIAFPEFAKCGELQLKVIKRVNDEGEGIRKLVLETVRDLWFRSLNDTTTTTSDAQTVVSHKVMSLLHVISVMLQNDGSIDSLHQLIEQIVKNDCELSSAQTIVDFVVARVLTAAEPPPTHGAANRALINLAAIHLVAIFARISPQILVKHCDSLQSLLSLSCDTIVDIHLRNKLIQSLERILQRVSHPSQQLMTRLEEDLTKQILQSSALILPSSVKCLAVVIAFHTKNFKLSTDLFHKFKQYMLASRDPQNKPRLLRSIYSLGLFVKHFAKHFDSQSKQLILDHILALIQSQVDDGLSDSDVIVRCVTSLGFIIESDPKICLQRRVIELYLRLLAEGAGDCFCAQVLTNFRNYLNESLDEDERVNKAIEWSRESLKTMTSEDCDSNSTQSQIIQTYLTPILDKSISASAHIRRVACNVVHVIHSGGHVHPLQLVPHLIAMTTDDDRDIRSRADHVLHEIERKFHGFVAMKARAGILLATELCARVKCRGYRLLDDNSGDVTSRLATLYHVVCTNRQSRRGFVQQLLRNFEVTSSPTTTTDDTAVYESSATTETTHDDQSTTSDDQSIQLVFEMLLFFPFTVCDEIMYILQQLECIQSVNSTHTSQLFTELFGFESEEQMDDKFDDNYDTFANDLRENETTIVCRQQVLKQIQRSLRRVFLVSILRKLLKEFYLIKDEKILEYSPNEPKVWEKPIHRRQIESSNLCETLSLASPALGVEPKIDDLLEELKRFKSVSLTSNDPNISNALINQKLFQIKKRVESQSKAFTIEANHRTTQMDDELNESERKRLLDSIRKTSCHVKLIDISLTPQTTAATTERTESVAKRKDRKSPKKEKRKRIRVEDDTSDDQTTDDDNHYDRDDTDDDDRH
ncbi:unnamed protein product [Medioppia subpectinata]|uniref:Nipped-B protein n=1 Tax=Medioppia subpectinata TaxID=1979941 RepID=A0A7R9KGJ7_9ACAR|nr:unnamed protein product [Medioppia subpectinata]CAG2101801.1 unnamed protein product [Medioppia subpectinata]